MTCKIGTCWLPQVEADYVKIYAQRSISTWNQNRRCMCWMSICQRSIDQQNVVYGYVHWPLLKICGDFLYERKVWYVFEISRIQDDDRRRNKSEDLLSTFRQWWRIHVKLVRSIFTQVWDTTSVYMCQHATTKWCSRKRESTSCRNLSKHVTCKECSKKILGWSYANGCPCDQQASPAKARVCLTIWDTMGQETYS